jgi:hypothetical protein
MMQSYQLNATDSNSAHHFITDVKIRDLYLTVIFDSTPSKRADQLNLNQLADLISVGFQRRIDVFGSKFTMKLWIIDMIDSDDSGDEQVNHSDGLDIGLLFFNEGKLELVFTELELNDYAPLSLKILSRVNLPVTHLRVNSENLIAIAEIWKVKLPEILSDVTQVTYTDEQLFFDSSHRIISDFTKQLKMINCEDHGTLTPTVVGRNTPYSNVEQFDGVIDECDLSPWQKIFPKVTHFELSLPSC